MKHYFKKLIGTKSSIQRKVIIAYLLLAVVPICIITIFSSAIYYNNMLTKSYSLLEQNSRQHEVVVQERLQSYESVLYELVTNKEYINLAKKINSGDENSLLIDKAHMETLLRNCVYTYDRIRSVTFLADSGDYVSYSKWYDGTAKIIWTEPQIRTQVYREIEVQQGLTFLASVNLSKISDKDDYVILMGYPVKNLRTKYQSGVLVIALEDDILLFDSVESNKEDSGMTTVIVDRHNKVIAGVEGSFVNDKYEQYLLKKFGSTGQITGKRYDIRGSEWTIVNIIDLVIYKREIYHLIVIVCVLMVTITSLFLGIVFLVSRGYIGTIQSIAKGIHDYEGTGAKPIDVRVDTNDELHIIVRQFNNMIRRVNLLVETLRQRNEEIKEAAVSQKHAEIKALEAQINPHFLYNTLDSINWRAIEHEEEEISDMLGALGSLMRYSVSNIEMQVVLAAEISWLKKYIFLQRDRFGDSFDCRYDITPAAMAFPIYKMMIQPLVENAILHGFEAVKQGGMIDVGAFIRADRKLQIRIRDNGCGMSPELLAEIRLEIAQNRPLNSKRIGISNVVHRLQIYYQEEAAITVNSSLGEGTEFVIVVPDGKEQPKGGAEDEVGLDCGR